MSPTIVLKDGRPIMTLGAAGGPKIITQVVLTIIHHLDRSVDLWTALEQPRLHRQWSPNRLWVEKGFQQTVFEKLTSRHHDMSYLGSGGVCQAISLAANGNLLGASDPRVPGKTARF